LQFVAGNYFSTLGVNAVQGRALQPSDDQRGTQPQVVLSYEMWQRRFGAEPSVVGSTLMVNNRAMTVAGIMPAGFFGTRLDADPPEIWAPLAFEPMLTNIDAMDHPSEYWLYVIGRAPSGFDPATLNAQTSGLLQGWLQAHPETLDPGQSAVIAKQRTEWAPAASGISQLRDNYASGLRLLLMIAGFVLLIVCANLANLMLVRGMARRQKTSVRLALGAPRARLIRQTLTESLLIAVAGSVVAVMLAVFGSRKSPTTPKTMAPKKPKTSLISPKNSSVASSFPNTSPRSSARARFPRRKPVSLVTVGTANFTWRCTTGTPLTLQHGGAPRSWNAVCNGTTRLSPVHAKKRNRRATPALAGPK
jgi:hypothetical protein